MARCVYLILQYVLSVDLSICLNSHSTWLAVSDSTVRVSLDLFASIIRVSLDLSTCLNSTHVAGYFDLLQQYVYHWVFLSSSAARVRCSLGLFPQQYAAHSVCRSVSTLRGSFGLSICFNSTRLIRSIDLFQQCVFD